MDFLDDALGDRTDRNRQRQRSQYDFDLADPASAKTCHERLIQDALRDDADVRAIAANPAVLALLGKLIGRPAFPFQTLNFPVGIQQDAHSDPVHFSSLPERFMCGVWLAMEDVAEGSGPLFYHLGSHH